MFSKGENTYKFPTKVFTPEAKQTDVFSEFEPLLNEFTDTPGRNVMCLAYGQTGTGKTHTIFGKKEAALDMNEKDEWGIFPKVVDRTFAAMQAKGAKYKLFISSLEFYLAGSFDLLDKNKVVTIDQTNGPRVSTEVEITSIEDLVGVMQTIFKNRVAAATKMN